ncbi:MAG: response regulator [Rhodocyclaceae bacterium]|nr:response regulator [Rhodocyclaceae bacterium]
MPVSQHINILVIDDEPETLTVIAETLAAPHCRVVAATSGTEALRQILKIDFALILLDVSLPEMDGLEVATLIRQVKRSSHIPIIFLTAAGDAARPTFRGSSSGFVDYIAKPVDAAALQSMVANFAGACGKSAKAEMGKVGEDLDTIIRERTASLIRANDDLRREVGRRERAEADLHAARLEAEAANMAKSEFLANMSHEIRTPMNGIIGLMELVLQTRLTAEQREYLDLVKVSAGALLTIINDILDFSKIEAGSLEIECIPFSLRESIGDTMKALAIEASRKGLEIACEIGDELPDAVLGDPVRVRQIVTNLVGNAIKFTASGEVVLRVQQRARGDGEVTCDFTVSDTGIGIPAGKLKTIFAPFLQGDSSTTRVYGGTGLGLTIAARLVEIMGGTLGVESTVGSGSTFRFMLRFREPAPAAPAAAAVDFAGVRVLAAVHPVSRLSLLNTLRHWNVDVCEAADGTAAKACIAAADAAARPFDLVLLDDSLPGTDSYALAAQIARTTAAGATAVAVLGSVMRRQVHAEQLASAAFASLTKPVKQSELLALINAASGRAGAALPPAAARPRAKAGPALDVLLVEDNAINCRLAQQVLVKAGHRVVTADNGTAALAALARGGFDLVLMDVQMPGMDGIEATTMIRKNEERSGEHLPIIALTAHAMAQHRERCLRAGMDAFLVKPIRPQDLLAAIAQLECGPRRAPKPRRKPVVDRAVLLERIDGDMDLLLEVTDMLVDKGARLMADARAALVGRNAGQCALLIHTLAGMFRSLAADAALDVVDRLEIIVAEENWELMEKEFARLEREAERLAAELLAMSKERGSRGRGMLPASGAAAGRQAAAALPNSR